MLIGLAASLSRLDRSAFMQLLRWRYIVFAQFCGFFLLSAILRPSLDGNSPHYRLIELESWSLTLLCVVVLGLWLHIQRSVDIKRALIQWLPAGLSAAFSAATLIYFLGPQAGRMPFFTPNPLVPPLWFLILTMTSFAWFSELSSGHKLWRFLIFCMAGVMAVYGGARLIIFAWVLGGCVLVIVFYFQTEKQHRFRFLLRAALGLITGMAGVIGADVLGGGYLESRMLVFTQVDFTYHSISQRFPRVLVWVGALSIISDNSWIGIGQVNERFALNQELGWDRWFRAHQTYISYLMAGGMPALLSGLAMQGVVFEFVIRAKRSALFPVFLGLGVVVTMNCLTESVFQSAVSLQVFMAATLFFLKASDADQPILAPQKHVSSAII